MRDLHAKHYKNPCFKRELDLKSLKPQNEETIVLKPSVVPQKPNYLQELKDSILQKKNQSQTKKVKRKGGKKRAETDNQAQQEPKERKIDLNDFNSKLVQVKEIFESQGLGEEIKDFHKRILQEDPFRNGLALCLYVHRRFNQTIKSVCQSVVTLEDIRRNFSLAFDKLARILEDRVLSEYHSGIDRVIRGDYILIFDLIIDLEKSASKDDFHLKHTQ